MINNVVLTGRLVRKPELKESEEGVDYCTFTLAVQRNYRRKDGEIETDFIDVVNWGPGAKRCSKYLKKGKLAGVEGMISTYTIEKEDKKYKNYRVKARRVQFLEWPDK
ncbi:MAG: single-stranded DNA-binding protein [Halanaerobiales bacterium]|nr:single-stranded DNA-binding protein [Halanaerobiales bacterium]